MSIFGIIALSFLVALAVTLVAYGILYAIGECTYGVDDWVYVLVLVGTLVVTWVGGTFVGIAINDERQKLFIVQYEAQKEVIESSLESEVLTGFERVELVKQASELNGELATRKAKYDIWHYVTYEDGLYDNVEPIRLK
jgi:hypothetical protein